MENEKQFFKINKRYKKYSRRNLKRKKSYYLTIIIIIILTCIIFLSFILIKFVLKGKIIFIQDENENKRYSIAEKIRLLKILTNNDKSEYKRPLECLKNDPDALKCIYHLLVPKKVIGKKKILLGKAGDGSYVLLDDFENVKIAYSFGIDGDVQFDKALADKGIDVYMYDHTINSLPYENSKFHWKKIGLCGKSRQYNNLKNFEELIEENGHSKERNMILKMDIEHWEWESIVDLKEETLNQFKYIAIEYHFKNNFNNNNLYYNVFKKNL